MKRPLLSRVAQLVAADLAAGALGALAHAATPAELQADYSAKAGVPAVPSRGLQLFANRQGREWSCASCHGAAPSQAGRHASTGKPIGALAPAFNPERFTDPAKVEKWFRRNCNDVMGRECSAAEKADILSWLITLEP
jgi:mono/diheme cytochrome c family protein